MPSLEEMVSFEAVPIEPGLSDFSRDFQPSLAMANETYNVTLGVNEGVGPRYGMVQLPGQTKSVTTASLKGLRETALSAASGYPYQRNRCLGIASFSWENKQFFCWMVGSTSVVNFWPVADASGSFTTALSDSLSSPVTNEQAPSLLTSGVVLNASPTYVSTSPYAHHAKMASVTVRKGEEASPWLVAFCGLASADAIAGRINNPNEGSTNRTFWTGLNPLFYENTVRYSTATRKVNLYTFGFDASSDYSLWKTREYNTFTGLNGATRIYLGLFNADRNSSDVNFAGLTADATTVHTAGVTNASFLMVEDFTLTMGSTYTFVASAFAGKAFGCLLSKEVRGIGNSPVRAIDPVRPIVPADRRTNNERGTAETYYLEYGYEKSTCWKYWPSFHNGSAQRTPPAFSLSRARANNAHVTYGPKDSGILRAGRIYEFAFSFYSKLLGTETNVGTPAKVMMPSVDGGGAAIDNMFLTIYRKESGLCPGFESSVINIFGADHLDSQFPINYPINHLKYRVYYREFGTFEWLPAAEVDAAQLLFDPKLDAIYIGKDPLALSLGGQPGGFNDYSGLPDVTWIDVVEYKGRVFWFGEQEMIFSLRENVLAYPGRNSTTIPSGSFRGAIVHAFPGQASQDARLIVFTDEDQYVGVFRGVGYGQLATIPVSDSSTAEFEYDGSDFYLERRSSYSAFSGRAACVADGILYFWGPAGIFEDSGVNIPDRISLEIDKLLPTMYHLSKTERIHCVYNPETKEVIWFYPPASGTSLTKAIVFNRRVRQFYTYDLRANRIDWSSAVNLVKTSINSAFGGKRIILGVNTTEAGNLAQNPVFFDQKIHEGDMGPGTLCWCETVDATGQAAGKIKVYLSTTASILSVSVGDIVTFKNVAAYNPLIVLADCKAVVTLVDSTNVALVVQLPTGIAKPADFTNSLSSTVGNFPAFVSSLHKINYVFRTKYWCPATMHFWGWWKHAHLVFKTTILPQSGQELVTLKHRPPQNNCAEASYSLDLSAPNCDGFHQVMRALSAENNCSTGQGLRWELSGSHTGGEWYLQYLKAQVVPMPAGEIAEFEG